MTFGRLFIASAIALTCGTTAARAEVTDEPSLRPAQQAMAARLQAIVLARSKSADLRLRIIYSQNGEVDAERRPDNGDYGAEVITAAELYEQARGSTDPLVLGLLLRRCAYPTKTMDRCDRLDLARRWTDVDTQNQVAWLALAGVLKERKDTDAAREAFRRAAGASMWHEQYGDIARLIARTLPKDLPVPEREVALVEALAKANYGSPINELQTLWGFCKDDGAGMRDACGRIVETMARDAETVLSMNMAIRYAVKARLDPALVATYQRRVDAFQWAAPSVFGTRTIFDRPDDAAASREVVRLTALVELGERRRSEDALVEMGLTEAEAARRRVATLSAEELSRRAEIVDGKR